MQGLNSGDTAWMLASAAHGAVHDAGARAVLRGMVRRKNVLSTTMHSFFAMGSVTIIWALVGYTLAFGDGTGALAPFIGGLDYLGLNGRLGPAGAARADDPAHRSSRCTRACSRSSPSGSSPARSPSA